MRLAVFSASTPYQIKGGMEAIAFDIVSGLAPRGADVLWITSPFEKPLDGVPASIRSQAARNRSALTHSAPWWARAQSVDD
jgi:hypothetical protein